MSQGALNLFTDPDDRYRRVQDAQVGHHGRNASDTELASALAQVATSGEKRRRVMLAIADAGWRGLTDHELTMLVHLPMSSINSTRNTLVGMDHVEDSGHRRLSPFNHKVTVWVATAKGKVAARNLRSES